MDKNDITIQILGQNYTIKTPADEAYIKKVAMYVEDKMKELKDSGMDSNQHLKIAVLACMNIADELLQEKNVHKQENELINKIKSKTLSLKDYVDQQIVSFEKRNKIAK
tara:strand:+ start:534 stop:860 length:327 start_codon:yes stop_codon:yes gene_type:complete